MDNVHRRRDNFTVDRSTVIRTRRGDHRDLALATFGKRKKTANTHPRSPSFFFKAFRLTAARVAAVAGYLYQSLIRRVATVVTAILVISADRASAALVFTPVIVVCHQYFSRARKFCLSDNVLNYRKTLLSGQ